MTLSESDGRRTILYFYPEAGTPGCTDQACSFRDNLGSLTAAGIRVLGVSRDSVEKLAAFDAEHGLNFPVLSDPDRRVHELYATWGEKSLYGKTITGALRSTFVVEVDGTISYAGYNVKAKNHVEMLRKRLGF